MNKYSLKQINKNALLHDKVFMTTDDVAVFSVKILEAAVTAGADANKLVKILESMSGDSDE